MTAAARLRQLDAGGYQQHWLHSEERDWPETNCYVDLWVEVVNQLGLDPVPSLAFTLSTDFDGEQWEFFKHPPEDLRSLYGIEVHELNAWRSLERHIQSHLDLGHYLTIEADSWYLPDTAELAYRLQHQKSSILPAMLDVAGERIGYFHNRGYFEAAGEDYRGVLRLDAPVGSLPPYVELVDLERMSSPTDAEVRAIVDGLVRSHLGRRPATNPVARLAERIHGDVDWLRTGDDEMFHGYAFGTLRQCGAWASTAAAFVEWLGADFATSARAFAEISTRAKSAQFQLARIARGRTTDIDGSLQAMTMLWDTAYDPLVDAFDA